MRHNTSAAILALLPAIWVIPGAADWTEAACEIYPKGSDTMEKMIPCTFGQRRGHITITRKDGVTR